MIRTRFAPSPTGSMHVGNLRTAFYAYALAKHEGGDFILRIEDTDKKREVKDGVADIKDLLTIFKIKWDEFHTQSERLPLYSIAAKKLVSEGKAYEDEGAIRIKIPKGEKIHFHDFVLNKDISWDSDVLEDLVLLKSDGFPTYHLASVVDDHKMNITHILRGHDWLPSTPLHLLLYKFLDYKIPEIGHLTDIMDPEGGKLSKRKGSTSARGLLEEGYLPEAIFNFVILLGWAPKDNRELFTLEEFVENFDPKGFQKGNPVFNREKLDWFNGEYIRNLRDEDLNFKFQISNFKFAELDKTKQIAITKLLKDRIKKISDINELAKFFWEAPVVDKKLFGENYKIHLEKAVEAIEKDIPLDQVPKNNDFKVGDFFMTLRIAITGMKFTPPINESIEILGKEETLKRLRKIT